MIVYIAGPITGHPDYRERFGQAEREIRELGHGVLNPAWLPDEMDYEAYMRIDSAMLRECDAVYLLPGWMQSDGVARELGYADTMRKKIVFYREELVDHG